LPKKCTLFFLPVINPKSFSPTFSFVVIFHSFLMNMPITYIEEIETTLLTLFGCYPWFY
jgi:hypothetical protein